jgi:hypothetical protein
MTNKKSFITLKLGQSLGGFHRLCQDLAQLPPRENQLLVSMQ